MSAPKRYTRSQIWLHWIVVALVLFQFLFHDSIARAWWGGLKGEAVAFSPMVALHVVTGAAIFVLVIWRLMLRRIHGTPPPLGSSPLQNLIAGLAHLSLYAILVLMFLSGLVAWFGMVRFAGEVHSLLESLLLLLIGLHVLGALYHQVMLQDNLIMRMQRSDK